MRWCLRTCRVCVTAWEPRVGSPGQCRCMQPVCGLPTLDRRHMRLIWLGTHCSDCYLQESGYGRRVPLWNLFGCRGHWMYNQCPAPCNCVTECRQLTSNALFARPAFRKAEDDARNISQVSKARLDATLGILTWWWQGGWTACRRSLKVPSNSGDSSVLRFSYTQHRSKNLVSSCLQFVFIVKVYFRIFTEEMKLFFF